MSRSLWDIQIYMCLYACVPMSIYVCIYICVCVCVYSCTLRIYYPVYSSAPQTTVLFSISQCRHSVPLHISEHCDERFTHLFPLCIPAGTEGDPQTVKCSLIPLNKKGYCLQALCQRQGFIQPRDDCKSFGKKIDAENFFSQLRNED